jgi:hypothetical protein
MVMVMNILHTLYDALKQLAINVAIVIAVNDREGNN